MDRLEAFRRIDLQSLADTAFSLVAAFVLLVAVVPRNQRGEAVARVTEALEHGPDAHPARLLAIGVI
jgi:hypothetical protein